METKKRKGVIAALFVIIAVGGGLTVGNQFTSTSKSEAVQIQTYEAVQAKKDYTIMVYMIGSDLESDGDEIVGAASDDLSEMKKAMSGEGSTAINDRTNLVIETGGSESWKMEELKDVKHARFTIGGGGIEHLDKKEDMSMGESGEVSDFINYASGKYPADNYILIFWDHGNGPVDGYGYDMLHDGDSLTLSELQLGVKDSEVGKMQLIGFDACLMGNIETINALSNYSEYIVGSEDLEAQNGWNYEWLDIFRDKPKSGKDVGTYMVDTYYDYYKEKGGQKVLACYDTKAYDKVKSGLEYYGEQVLKESSQNMFEDISKKRMQMQSLGNSRMPTDCSDIVDLAELYRNVSPDIWSKSGLEDSIQKMVIYTKAVGYSSTVCGVNIYLPSGSDYMLQQNINKYKNCKFEKNYIQFAYDYARQILLKERIDIGDINMSYNKANNKIVMHLDKSMMEHLAAVYIVTAYPLTEYDDCSFVISTDSEAIIEKSGTVTAVVDDEYVTLGGQLLSLIEHYNSELYTDYLSPVLYNDELCMMKVRFSEQYRNGVIVNIVPSSENGDSSKKEYLPEPGDSITPLYPLIVGEHQDVKKFKEDDKIYKDLYYKGDKIYIENKLDISLDMCEVNKDECLFGFMVQDTGQNIQYTDWFTQSELEDIKK